MISIDFVNRTEELQLLRRLWKQDRAFVVVFGRRRVGKTRLIQEFSSDRDTFFFTFSDTYRGVQLLEFRSRAAEYLGDNMILNLGGDWYDTLKFFFSKLEDGATVVLDEFTYAIRADRKMLSDLQRLWDNELREQKMKLIISGSMLGMVKDDVLAHTSPLYGRRTRDIHLGALGYRHALDFFSDPLYGVQAYMVVGGMPEYLLVASEHGALDDLVTHEFLDHKGYFFREPYYTLSQDLKDMKTYFALLNAMAYGKTKPGEIAHFVGVEPRSIYPYLENLQRLEFIRREVSLGGNTRRGIYKLVDPAMFSWFNLVYKRRHEIELGVAHVSHQQMTAMLGTAFESLATEFVAGMNRRDAMGMTSLGRWWHKGEEIDIIGIDTSARTVFMFEVKYTKMGARESNTLLNSLERKAELTPWQPDRWKFCYGLIARELSAKEDLRTKGYLCYDLADIISLTGRR